jgi:conjugative transfer signal peptidase TraF
VSFSIHHIWGIIINYTASLPKGLYRLHPLAPDIERDMLVALHVPAPFKDMVYGRGWLFKGSLVLKPVAAVAGDRILITDEGLSINKRYVGPVYSYDTQGLPLPVLRMSYTLKEGQIFLASTYPRSFDSRYFGPVNTKDIIAQVIPLFTFSP